MGSDGEGSTNAVDQLLSHTNGPVDTVDSVVFDRLKYSKEIVDINYTRLNDMCDDMAGDGLVYVDNSPTYDDDSVRVNIYANIHNYLSSIYSSVEELHQFVNSCSTEEINKRTFVRGSDRADHSLPLFVQKLVFAWGLRNQFTHGNYRCLTITKDNAAERNYFEVQFHKTRFNPRGRGDLKDVGDYLWGVDREEERYPMCYFAVLHSQLVGFWDDTEAWYNRVGN